MRGPLIVIFLGRSGCGKGTQAKLLREKFGLEYLGSGDLLRARAQMADYSGQTLKAVLADGAFAPTSLIFKLWIDKLDEFKNKPDFPGFIFDGSPRKILEAHLIDEALDWYSWKDLAKVFLIDVPRQVTFDRLIKRGRADDIPELIKNRLDLYEKEVQPVVNYYQKDDRIIKIDGDQSIEKVFDNILNNLEK